MNKKPSELLAEEIEKHDGFILSDGTLNMNHLLPKAYDLLVGMEANEELRNAILNCFEYDGEFEDGESLFMKQYYGEAYISRDYMDEANAIWNEDVYNYFNFISPDGYYFGSSEGDGACIGWFRYEDEETEEDEDCDEL